MRTSLLLAAIVGYAIADSTSSISDPTTVNATLHLDPLPKMAYATALIADLSLPYSVGEQMEAGGLAQVTTGWDMTRNEYIESWSSSFDATLNFTRAWTNN